MRRFIFYLFAQSLTALAYGEPPRSARAAAHADGGLDLLIIGILFFGMLALYTLASALSSPPKPKPKPTLADLVSEEVGRFEKLDASSMIGSKLIESKNGVDTYLTVTKVDREKIRRYEEARAQSSVRSLRRFVLLLVVAIALMALWHLS